MVQDMDAEMAILTRTADQTAIVRDADVEAARAELQIAIPGRTQMERDMDAEAAESPTATAGPTQTERDMDAGADPAATATADPTQTERDTDVLVVSLLRSRRKAAHEAAFFVSKLHNQ